MNWGLTGLELRAFVAMPPNSGRISKLATAFGATAPTPMNVSELAERLEISVGLASTTSTKLEQKGLASTKDDGKQRLLTRSLTPASLALAELIAANPHVDFATVLANSSIRVLAGFAAGPTSIKLAAKSTLAPEVTVRRVVSMLTERALMQKCGHGKYQMGLPKLMEFVSAWLLVELEVSRRVEVPGSLLVFGPHGLLRSSKHNVPTWMVHTGISSFHKYGVRLSFDFEDYYFHAFSDEPIKLGLEEHLVHALLRSTLIPSSREISYALLVLYKNRRKLKEKKFLEYAAMLGGAISGAQQALEKVDLFISGEKWPAPSAENFQRIEWQVWPSQAEFEELVKQYE